MDKEVPVPKRKYRKNSSTKKPESFTCSICLDEFSSYYYMKQHEARVHQQGQLKTKKPQTIMKTFIDIVAFVKKGILVMKIKTKAYQTFLADSNNQMTGTYPHVLLYYNDPDEDPIMCRIEEFASPDYSLVKPITQNDMPPGQIRQLAVVAKIKEYWDEEDQVAKYHILSPYYNMNYWSTDLRRAFSEKAQMKELNLPQLEAVENPKPGNSVSNFVLANKIKQSDSSMLLDQITLSKYEIQETNFMDEKYNYLQNGKTFLETDDMFNVKIKESQHSLKPEQLAMEIDDHSIVTTPKRSKREVQCGLKKSYALINGGSNDLGEFSSGSEDVDLQS